MSPSAISQSALNSLFESIQQVIFNERRLNEEIVRCLQHKHTTNINFKTRHSENIFSRKEQIWTEHVLGNKLAIRQQRTWYVWLLSNFCSFTKRGLASLFAEVHVVNRLLPLICLVKSNQPINWKFSALVPANQPWNVLWSSITLRGPNVAHAIHHFWNIGIFMSASKGALPD